MEILHLRESINQQNLEYVKTIINNDYMYNYALSLSMEDGNIRVLKYLLQKEFNYNINYSQLLRVAELRGHTELVNYLVQLGVNVNSRNNALSKLSTETNYTEVIKDLIEDGIDIHIYDTQSARRWSACDNNIEVVKLFACKDNIHDRDDCALRCSARNGHFEILKHLIDLGANINARDDYPLRWSARNGHKEIVEYLVKLGANVNACDNYPIFWAGRNGHIEIVKYLILQGANPLKIKDLQNISREFKEFEDNIIKIQRACHNWLWAPVCKDGTMGLMVKKNMEEAMKLIE